MSIGTVMPAKKDNGAHEWHITFPIQLGMVIGHSGDGNDTPTVCQQGWKTVTVVIWADTMEYAAQVFCERFGEKP